MKNLTNGWVRYEEEERDDVYRWYERKKGRITASLVKGNFPNELQWRISSDKYDSFEISGT